MKIFIRNCVIALLGSVLFMSTTCEPEILYQQKVIVNNKTDEDILIFSVIKNHIDILKEDLMSMYRFDMTKMLSANSAVVLDCFFWYKDNGAPSFDTLLVMIIRRSTLDKYPLGYLIENNLYDEKFILSFDQIKSMDFQVIYKD